MVLSQACFAAFQAESRPYFLQSSPFTTTWGLEHVLLQVLRQWLLPLQSCNMVHAGEYETGSVVKPMQAYITFNRAY